MFTGLFACLVRCNEFAAGSVRGVSRTASGPYGRPRSCVPLMQHRARGGRHRVPLPTDDLSDRAAGTPPALLVEPDAWSASVWEPLVVTRSSASASSLTASSNAASSSTSSTSGRSDLTAEPRRSSERHPRRRQGTPDLRHRHLCPAVRSLGPEPVRRARGHPAAGGDRRTRGQTASPGARLFRPAGPAHPGRTAGRARPAGRTGAGRCRRAAPCMSSSTTPIPPCCRPDSAMTATTLAFWPAR